MGINIYIMVMISQISRQIVGLAVESSKEQAVMQVIVESIPPAQTYHTDVYYGYGNIISTGRHNKKDIRNKLLERYCQYL